MFNFLILIALIGLALLALSWVHNEPDLPGSNVLTDAEAKLVADEAAKAKAWLSRFWARITADPKTDQEP